MKPNFILAGVARCGTTSLSRYLSQHPEISFGKKKEPKFISFAAGNEAANGPGDDTVNRAKLKTLKSYEDNYREAAEPFVGDGSSDTFYYHETTIPLIKNLLGDVPIIIVIRNPSERSISAYNNLLRDSREKRTLAEGLEIEEQRIRNGYDWMWHYRSGSKYAKGISHFIRTFSKVKIILNDDLLARPEEVMRETLEFLGVNNTQWQFDTSVKYSTSGVSKYKWLNFLMSRTSPLYWLREKIIDSVSRQTLEQIAKVVLNKKDASSIEKGKLKQFFLPDIQETSTIIERDLTNWLR